MASQALATVKAEHVKDLLVSAADAAAGGDKRPPSAGEPADGATSGAQAEAEAADGTPAAPGDAMSGPAGLGSGFRASEGGCLLQPADGAALGGAAGFGAAEGGRLLQPVGGVGAAPAAAEATLSGSAFMAAERLAAGYERHMDTLQVVVGVRAPDCGDASGERAEDSEPPPPGEPAALAGMGFPGFTTPNPAVGNASWSVGGAARHPSEAEVDGGSVEPHFHALETPGGGAVSEPPAGVAVAARLADSGMGVRAGTWRDASAGELVTGPGVAGSKEGDDAMDWDN